LIGGATRPDKDVFIGWNEPENPNASCVVTPDGWKLGIFDKDNCVLFRHTTDPLELENLYYRDNNQETIGRLRAKIEAWQRSIGDRLAL
jgi:hypothetical protein